MTLAMKDPIMSTLTSPVAAAAAASAPSLLTLIRVESRKLVDTRRMIAALAAAALFAGATGGGQTLRPGTSTLGDVATMALLFTPYFLVAFVAGLVTSEYGHRTSLSTFALTPRRGRVFAAKGATMILLALVASTLGLIAGVLISAVVPMLGIAPVAWSLDAGGFAVVVGLQLTAALIGWALGMATGSLAITLAAYLIFPMVSSLVSGLSPDAARVLDWLRPDTISTLADGITATSVGQTATSVMLWIVVPAVIGWARLAKGEVR